MRKKILIPTDFTVQSLNTLKNFLQNTSETSVDLVLLHGMHAGDSIRDLLFKTSHKHMESLVSQEFEEAIEVLKNKFQSQINTLKTDFFSGFTQTAFNNYTEANKIDQIVMSNQKPKLQRSKSFDLAPFIKKSSINTVIIDTTQNTNLPEKGKLAEVFFNQVSVG